MPNGVAKFLKHLGTLGQRRKKTTRRPARATVRAMFLTMRGTQPGRPGFYNPAVTPRAAKARKAPKR